MYILYTHVYTCVYNYTNVIYTCTHTHIHKHAYGPKTQVAKRYFFPSEVLDATLMMGWGGVGWGLVGHVNVRVKLLKFLMLR